MDTLKIRCQEWLHENFGIEGVVTKAEILKQANATDIELDLVGVAFEFEGPDGSIGDSVAYLDKTIVEEAIISEIFTTQSAQIRV